MEPIHPKTHRTFIWIIAALSVLVVFASILLNQVDFSSKIKSFEETANNFFVQKLHSDSFMPPPLRGVFGEPKEPLTEAGVLLWTNKNRQDVSINNLTQSETLSKMAAQKLGDLFTKQYFEHESPSGVGPSDLAKQNGYDYIVIGENLALGNFDGDKALVDAWMASPGHRANILNTRYHEIGIAVGQGVFEGKNTWIAVQEFGLPITACPQPSVTDKSSIDQTKKNVDALEVSLAAQKKIIDSATIKYGTDYNAYVEKYNISVQKFNAMVLTLKAKISSYNKQVAAFNNCAEVTSTTPEKI
jgi:uncharacterized protein YkwD